MVSPFLLEMGGVGTDHLLLSQTHVYHEYRFHRDIPTYLHTSYVLEVPTYLYQLIINFLTIYLFQLITFYMLTIQNLDIKQIPLHL